MIKLKNKIVIILSIFSLSIILLISFISNILVKSNFNQYIKADIEKRKATVVQRLSSAYVMGNWDKDVIEEIGLEALDEGLIIKVSDYRGKTIWNANESHNGMCQAMLGEMNSNMEKVNPKMKDNYVEEEYLITKGSSDIGTVQIGYSGPVYYKSSDITFLKGLNLVLLMVSVIAIILSIIIGVVISSNISKPILEIEKATDDIINSRYKKKLVYKNNIKEISQMINSINELSDSLEKDERMRKMLTRDISHELRTPLTTIRLQVEALIDGMLEVNTERLTAIQQEILRLTRLVKSLEELSQYDKDNLKLNKEKVEISKLIKVVLLNFEKLVLDKNIIIKTDLEYCELEVDKDKITQAIVNLISNSIKYSEDRGVLEITSYSDKNYGYIAIKDNGIGISEEHLQHIFKRFYRVDSSRARKTGGAGVGLTIANSIVEAHHGEISVKSKLNEGSEFTLKLPLKS